MFHDQALIHFYRGQADIKTEQIHRVLGSLFEYRLDWSKESLSYFPEAVRSFYTDPQSHNQKIKVRPTINPAALRQQVINNKALTSYLLQGSPEHESIMVSYFSVAENQASLLCVLWIIAVMQGSMDVFHMPCEYSFSQVPYQGWLLTLFFHPISRAKAAFACSPRSCRYACCGFDRFYS